MSSQIPPQNPSPTASNNSPYPVITKQAATIIDAISTNTTSNFFTDKIMITISQDSRLAQWVHVPLNTPNPNFSDHHLAPSSSTSPSPFASDNDDTLLPLPHLTPHTLLGTSTTSRETVGQLLATQIASTILTRNPAERRTVLLGLGLREAEISREGFYDIIDLVGRCL